MLCFLSLKIQQDNQRQPTTNKVNDDSHISILFLQVSDQNKTIASVYVYWVRGHPENNSKGLILLRKLKTYYDLGKMEFRAAILNSLKQYQS